MPLSNYHHFILVQIIILTISACSSTMPATSGTTITPTSDDPVPETTQTANQLSQIQAQLTSL